MKTPRPWVRGAYWSAILSVGLAGYAQAQTVASGPAPDAAPPGAASVSEDVVELSPFVVTAEENDGYRATNTLAGTRIKTELRDVGSAISVVTEQFLRDLGAKNSGDLLIYTTNTEVGGIGGNFTGTGNNAVMDDRDQRMAPQRNTRVRGLAAADNTRDYFLTDIPWDSYVVDRLDLQRGPNSILFGLGSPAGIINSTVNGAGFKTQYKGTVRFGSYDSLRGVADLNQVLLPDELSVRVALLSDRTNYRQEPAYNLDKRRFGAVRWDPAFLNKGSSHTSFKANYEYGDINGNRPRTMAPLDAITPWFTDMGRATYDPRTVAATTPSWIAYFNDHSADYGPNPSAASQFLDGGVPNPNFQPWLGPFGRVYDNPVAFFLDETSGAMGGGNVPAYTTGSIKTLYAPGQAIGGISAVTMRGITTYDQYALGNRRGLVDNGLGVYKATTIDDPTIFDFYNNLIDGPNKAEWQGFEAFDASMAQTFFNNRIGFEIVYDHQKYHEGQVSMLNAAGQVITVDIMTHLPDGTVNPNVGRPVLASDSGPGNNQRRDRTRESVRATAFGVLDFGDFMDKSSIVTRILGKHNFTGLWNSTSLDELYRTYARYSSDDVYSNDFINTLGLNSPNRLVATLSYLGPSIAGRNSASGAYIPRLQARQMPVSGAARLFDSHYTSTLDPDADWTNPVTLQVQNNSDNPANYPGWVDAPLTVWNADLGDENRLYTTANKSTDKVISKAFVWQGFLWDGVVVPTVGLRKDTARAYNAGPAPHLAAGGTADNQTLNPYSPLWVMPQNPQNTVSGNTKSWSVMVHTPRSIKEKMPLRSDLSIFYNKSDNFQPAASRVDVLGYPIAPPKGKTRDYGFVLNTLDDKLTLKVNWYKTEVSDDTLQGFGGTYMIWGAEAWGYLYGMLAMDALNGPNFAPGTDENPINGNWVNGYTPGPGQTKTQAIDEERRALAAFFGNLPSDRFYQVWQIDRSQWRNWMSGVAPAGLTITGDTISEGTEYEVIAQPTKNWSIAINAAKTSAQRLNMAGSLNEFVSARHDLYQTDAGLVRLWGPAYTPSENVRNKYERDFWSVYTLYRLQENADVPELRPWRFNLVTNYSFTEGKLAGVNVGMGYRWQDGVTVGYPITDGANGARVFDLARPYTGPSESNVDVWFGYERKLAEKVRWRVQLNIRNLFASKDLIPITVQPDGSAAASRIPDLTTWYLENTFTF